MKTLSQLSHHGARRKPPLSYHQKQVRLLSGMFMFVCFLLATVFFWMVNRINSGIH